MVACSTCARTSRTCGGSFITTHLSNADFTLTPGRERRALEALAAQAGVRYSIDEPRSYIGANIIGTHNVLELARHNPVRHLLAASTSSVYGANTKMPFSVHQIADHPLSLYAATKRAGELLAHTYGHLYGLSVVCLRFFTVYGPRQRPDLAIHKFARLMADGKEIPFFGDGSTRRDYTWVDDIVQGVARAVDYALAHPGCYELLNLGESDTVTLSRLVELLARALGVEPRLRRLPPQPGDVERTCADVSRARALLGYAPTTRIEQGIPLFVEWFRSTRAG